MEVNRFSRKLAMSAVALTMAGSMTVLATPSAYASTPVMQFNPASVTSTDGTLTPQQLKQVSHDLETLFTVYLSRDRAGIWRVNEAAARGSGMSMATLQTLATNMNTAGVYLAAQAPSAKAKPGTSGVTPQYAFGSSDYRRCVIDYSGFGAIAGLFSGAAGGFWSFIAAARWADSALVFIRIVGVRAITGGVAGLALALSAAAAWCATPWAR